MHQLQELDREFDVADAAGTALQLAVRNPLLPEQLLRARFHRARLSHRVGVQDVGPDERLRARHERVAEPVVARNRSRFEESLQLPVARPSFPVRREAVERPAQRARATFGPQVGVRAEHDPIRARARHHREDRARCVLRLLLVAFVDEHDVHIARVVQFSTAELAHADDREPGGRRGHVHRDREAGPCERGELGDDIAQVRDPEQVTTRDADDLLPLPPPQRRAGSSFGTNAWASPPKSTVRCSASERSIRTAPGSRSSAGNSDRDAVTTATMAAPISSSVASSSASVGCASRSRPTSIRAASGSADRSIAARKAGRSSMVSVNARPEVMVGVSRGSGAGSFGSEPSRRILLVCPVCEWLRPRSMSSSVISRATSSASSPATSKRKRPAAIWSCSPS